MSRYEKNLKDCLPYLRFLTDSPINYREAALTLNNVDIEIIYSLQTIMIIGRRYQELHRRKPVKNPVSVFKSWRLELCENGSKASEIDYLLGKRDYRSYLQHGMRILSIK